MPANAWVSARRYLCYMIGAAYLRREAAKWCKASEKPNLFDLYG
jgi:hypothetical protein